MTLRAINKVTGLIDVNTVLLNQLDLYALSIAFVIAIYTLFTKDFRLKEDSSKLILIIFLFSTSITLTIFQIINNDNILYFSFFLILLIILTIIIGIRNEEKIAIVALICLILVSIGLITVLFDEILSAISFSAFGLGWVGLFYIFYISYNKIYHLRDKRTLKHLWPFNKIDDGIKRLRKHAYEHDMEDRKIDKNTFKSLPDQLCEILSTFDSLKDGGYSFLLIFGERINSIDYGLKFSFDGLDNGEYINYVCVDKHPYEIYKKIKHLTQDHKNNFIFIDIFSPNYGFDDGINISKNQEIKNNGINIVPAKTIAGIHSSISKAFKIIESNVKKTSAKTRPPCRMIWDSFSSLADVSSKEIIKIFLNHVIPSERNYGMISIFIESENTDPEILNTLKRLVDATIVVDYSDGKMTATIKKMSSGTIKMSDSDIKLETEYEW